ncbi:FliI/YscN family ATPase [Gemmobacter serpentinus]|uniref:FliI/YscN family ATPase n=1 Tax=Gemmobacter serpentinus TaxID=2652247 RepID=UPI00124E1B01|nr:FliI/YscN family ATPase [Gemmobacter serpentinus]
MWVFAGLQAEIGAVQPVHRLGRVVELARGMVVATGLSGLAVLGDRVVIRAGSRVLPGEVVKIARDLVTILPETAPEGVGIADAVILEGVPLIAPDASWIGRIIDPFGQPLDGRPLFRGGQDRPLRAKAPAAAQRRRLGARLATGMAVFDTLLPVVRGQRIGLFAGSGVGKSSLLARFVRGMEADVVVIALIGERGRELRDFTERALGAQGLRRAVVVTATSDQPALTRRRCAWTAMAVAEHFRDQGLHVLFLADSVTRFAEAHREIALASGEDGSLRGYPPSTAHMIMSLAERAGPGLEGAGDITAIFSVLVAGSDMEEPVADILRGVLDGHVVLDRRIAERGRFPAIDLLRSVSRALPEAATLAENAQIAKVRRLLGAYEQSEMMVRAGLYQPGSDALIDDAVRLWPAIEAYLAEDAPNGVSESFRRLQEVVLDDG